jgi:type IV pilus assembly protein PilN
MVRINLLPVRATLRSRDINKFFRYATVAIASTVALAIFVYFALGQIMEQAQEQKKIQENTKRSLETQQKELEKLRTEIKVGQSKIDATRRIKEKREYAVPLLAAVSLSIPEDVWLSSLVFNVDKESQKSNFQVDGKTLNGASALTFVQNLKRIRQGLSDRRPFVSPASKSELTFLSDVKMLELVAESGTAQPDRLGPMTFKITGVIR